MCDTGLNIRQETKTTNEGENKMKKQVSYDYSKATTSLAVAEHRALSEFIGKTAGLTSDLGRLTDYIENHCDTDPDQIGWGHVGNLGRVEELLEEIMAFLEIEK